VHTTYTNIWHKNTEFNEKTSN